MSEQDNLLRLAFWGRNMTAVSEARMRWPGFSYTDDEWTRMRALAGAISVAAFAKFISWTTVVFIAVAAAAIVGVFLPLVMLLFPDMAQTPPWKFAALLATVALLCLTLGLSLSMNLAARWSADDETRASLRAAPGDDALAAKVRWQINRMALLMCGALVPGIVIWVAYDIHAGPLVTMLKWIAVALSLGSMAAVVVGNRR